MSFFSFFFNDTATTEIYTLSLHDALPISLGIAEKLHSGHRCLLSVSVRVRSWRPGKASSWFPASSSPRDRKSTRLNSSHTVISYAVFCLKKKKQIQRRTDIFCSRILMSIV